MCRRPLFVAVAALATVLGVTEAAAQQAVVCPEPQTQANFDAEKYLGSWYEMKRVARNFEDDGECGMAHYSWVDDTTKDAIDVLNTDYLPQNSSVSSVVLRAVPDDIANGKLNVVSPTLPQGPPSKYWVLGTDYDSYAVVYSCSVQVGQVLPHVSLWVLSRDPDKYTSEVDSTVNSLIADVGLDASVLSTVQHHKACPLASCKACSSPKQNLDLTRMAGRWATVLHSPYASNTDKQSCSMAEFTATSNGVKLVVTTYQVRFVRSVQGADSSQELQANWTDANKKDGSFDVAGGKVCVLGTDYDNWAVVSLCLPAPQTTQDGSATPVRAASGGVFVMSRKRGLTPEEQLEANAAVVNAGIPAASMEATPATPCPAASLAVNSAPAPSTTPPREKSLSKIWSRLLPIAAITRENVPSRI